MEGARFVAVSLQKRRERVGRAEDVLLIRDAARRQEGHRIARQKLELTRARACAEHRGIGMTDDRVIQTLDVIHRALAQRYVAEILEICPGLVHNGEDVRVLRRNRGQRIGFRSAHDSRDGLRRRILRLLDLHELGIAQKLRNRAARAVYARLVPDVGLDAEQAEQLRMQHRNEADRTGEHHHHAAAEAAGCDAEAVLTVLMAQAPREHHEQDDAHDHLPGHRKLIAVRDSCGSAQRGEVPRQDGRAAEVRDKIICRTPRACQQMQQHAEPRDMAEQAAREPVDRAETDPVRKRRAGIDLPRHRAEKELHQPERGERRDQQHKNPLPAAAARLLPCRPPLRRKVFHPAC